MAPRDDDFSESLRANLEPALKPMFSSEFVVCSELFDRHVTETAGRDLIRLGVDRELGSPATVEEILARRGFAPRAAAGLSSMLEKLSAEGFLERIGGDSPRFRIRAPLPSEPGQARERALAIDASSAPAFDAVDLLSASIEEFFTGKKTGEEILFAPTRLPLWFAYFHNDHLLYAVNNRLGAEAAARALPASRPAAILEIGGGAGSAALALLGHRAAAGRLDAISGYRFTEAVPTFLRRGERALKERFPSVPIVAGRLDMNLPFEAQGVAPESFDLVYAVNALHVARDLAATLSEIRRALRPGGALVVSECVRPRFGQPIYVEYIFNFLDNFVNVTLDPDIRPNHGFLTPAHWRAALTRTGFVEPQILPDVERLASEFPSFFVAAVSARRPA